ncbi:transposase, partial [Streptomyces sp. NPDC048665]|uniref:transposase n=1 Tax=Streptomyces sp. NPDC048665 TaxID=3155490 RepID=UPI00342E91DC
MAEPARPSGGGGAGGEGLGRSRGWFTSKLHLSADGRCRPLSLIVTPGQRADCTQFKPVLKKMRVLRPGPGRPRTKPDSLAADKAYSNGPCRGYLRRRGIRHTIPEKTDSQAARAKAHAADGHQASTKSGTRNATPSNERSTVRSSTGRSPLATTSAATSSSAPRQRQRSHLAPLTIARTLPRRLVKILVGGCPAGGRAAPVRYAVAGASCQ